MQLSGEVFMAFVKNSKEQAVIFRYLLVSMDSR